MSIIDCIVSNIIPVPMKKFHVRKRMFHRGYEILLREPNGEYLHVMYVSKIT